MPSLGVHRDDGWVEKDLAVADQASVDTFLHHGMPMFDLIFFVAQFVREVNMLLNSDSRREWPFANGASISAFPGPQVRLFGRVHRLHGLAVSAETWHHRKVLVIIIIKRSSFFGWILLAFDLLLVVSVVELYESHAMLHAGMAQQSAIIVAKDFRASLARDLIQDNARVVVLVFVALDVELVDVFDVLPKVNASSCDVKKLKRSAVHTIKAF